MSIVHKERALELVMIYGVSARYYYIAYFTTESISSIPDPACAKKAKRPTGFIL